MKVTISFNGTKIVVPCGDGEISVREVTTLAATRYKKAIGKTNAYWVSVASLKSHEGGILDPDDLIGDVCDDREQLAALFDEQNGGHYHGDGMSSASDSDTKESLVGGNNPTTSSSDHPLQVRRGSEPTLNNSDSVQSGSVQAVIASINARSISTGQVPRSLSSHAGLGSSGNKENMNSLRSSLRKTMVNSFGYSAVSIDDRSTQQSSPDSQYEDSGSLNVMRRREPLGASGNKPERPKSPGRRDNPDEEVYFEIIIPSELGQLGIHVVPCDQDGRLIVQGIEPGGRIDRDGRLAVEDAIVAINGYPLMETSFNKAQEIFKEALYAKELRLRILKGQNTPKVEEKPAEKPVVEKEIDAKSGKKTEMAAGTKITSAVHANNTRKIGKIMKISLKKGSLGLGFSITTRDNALGDNTPIYIKNILPKGAAIEEGSLKPGDRLLEVNQVSVDGMSQSDVVTLLRNVPLDSTVNLVVSRHSVETESEQEVPKMQAENDKGRKLQFQLDEKTDEEAMDSLEPNSMPSTNSASPGFCSSDNFESETEGTGLPWKHREILTFDIPVHDSERAGLGVSVKGKTSTSRDGVIDLGIFVKSVLHGGAASRDGRLMTNDQLVSINGMSLLGKANPAAMETLRKAMHEEGPLPGIISLAIARRKEEPPASQPQNNPELTRRDSLSSLPTSSDDEVVREYAVSAPTFKMPSTTSLGLGAASRNPVIDRLMGKDQASSASLLPSNLRNESYYMATNHETFNGSMFNHLEAMPTSPSPDSVFIEQPTNSNFLNNNDEGDDKTVTNESLTSLVDLCPSAFARDQPGRQSMSEKRHATLDAKATDTYQKRKKAREEREKQKESQQWKKSASLESLQLHHEVQRQQEGSPYQRANSVRVSRNRGCNESFRAAVDRSYEKDFSENPDYVVKDLNSDNNKVILRRNKITSSDSKKNRNSKLLRGFGNLFKSSNQTSVDKTKDTKQIRKSMPEPPASSSASSLTSTTSRGQIKSSPDIQDYQILNQMRLHPSQYVQQQPPRSHSQPRYRQANEYEYMPSSMMRPGSRVGIADNSDSPDYDVLHRLQNTHIQPQMRSAPPPVPMYHPYYAPTQPPFYNQYGYHQAAVPQQGFHHPRQGSNSSSGASNKSQRPKSNFYEYDYNNPYSSTTNQYYSSSELQQPSMYSLPRSTSGYP